ncbi:hypothetical protein BRADI_5g03030v3 [Brachypodium distachyon]|uniref:F-box associated domain-containing protein n=1 Tax=Brachypodium distachyon TaxID=15368 RepID=A0A0Q3H191_BRADI|nr:hypothetical protein BRADI_5g03030v3 [Brachypodium distachyon]
MDAKFNLSDDHCSRGHYRTKLSKKVTAGLLYQSHGKSAIPLVSLSRNDGEIDGILADVPHYEHLELVDCCNGLALCKYRNSFTSPSICRFVVCNPAIRQWRIVPDTHCATDDPPCVTFLAFDPSWSPQFYVFNFHQRHHHHLILGTRKLEIFFSGCSAWLVDETWNSEITFSGRKPRLFLNGMLYLETTGHQVLAFEGLEAISNGIPPYHWTITLPDDSLYVCDFTHGCFCKSSGILHYALPDDNGRSIAVWSLDHAWHLWAWNVKCHLSMKDAFGRNDFVYYNDGGLDGESDWFWNCDYRIVALDLDRKLLLLFDQKTDNLLLYDISTGKLHEIRDSFQWPHNCYFYYVPCYSELPAQEQPSAY